MFPPNSTHPSHRAANRLLRKGLCLIPVNPKTKIPLVDDWLDRDRAFPRLLECLNKEHSQWLGVLPAPSGLLVVDIDCKPGKTDGMALLADAGLLDQLRAQSRFHVRTPSGGLHLYFAGVGDHKRFPKSFLSDCGVDIIYDNRYVVAPALQEDSGLEGVPDYTVVHQHMGLFGDGRRLHFGKMSASTWKEFGKLIGHPEFEEKKKKSRRPPSKHLQPIGPSQLAELEDALEHLRIAGAHMEMGTWAKVCASLSHLADEDLAWGLLQEFSYDEEYANRPQWEKNNRAQFESFRFGSTHNPRSIKTIFGMAREEGWRPDSNQRVSRALGNVSSTNELTAGKIPDCPTWTARGMSPPDGETFAELLRWMELRAPGIGEGARVSTLLSVLGALAARNFCTSSGVFSNLAVIIVAPTGRGKSGLLKAAKHLEKAVREEIPGIVFPTPELGAHASAGAFMASLRSNIAMLLVLDEFGEFIDKATSKYAKSFEKEMGRAVRELLGMTRGDTYAGQGTVADAKSGQVLHDPALSILGFGTPEQLSSLLHSTQVENGLANRIAVCFADGDEGDAYCFDPIPLPDSEESDLLDRLAALLAPRHDLYTELGESLADGTVRLKKPALCELEAITPCQARVLLESPETKRMFDQLETNVGQHPLSRRVAFQARKIALLLTVLEDPTAEVIAEEAAAWACTYSAWTADNLRYHHTWTPNYNTPLGRVRLQILDMLGSLEDPTTGLLASEVRERLGLRIREWESYMDSIRDQEVLKVPLLLEDGEEGIFLFDTQALHVRLDQEEGAE